MPVPDDAWGMAIFAGVLGLLALAMPAPLIWESGTDADFWVAVVIAFVAGAAAVWAYVGLAAVRRTLSADPFMERPVGNGI